MQDPEQKKVMSSFDVSAVVAELRGFLIGKYLDNIYQLDHETFLLKFRPENRSLILQVGKRIHLTNYSITVPSTPSQFCMALRKYLRDGRITDITQYHFERIVVMQIESSKHNYQFVAEIFGRGNLILVGDDLKVILALRYSRMRDRDILRGETFVHAPSSGLSPLEMDRSNLESLRTSYPMQTARKLTKLLAIGGLFAREILLRSGVADNTPSNHLTDVQLDMIYESVRNLALDLQPDRIRPQIVVDQSGIFLTVQPFALRVYEGIRTIGYKTFNEASDEYFSSMAHGLKETADAKRKQREKERLSRILEMQKNEEKTLEGEIAHSTRIGEIIKRHYQEINDLTKRIQAGRSRGESYSEISSSIKKHAKTHLSSDAQLKGLDPKNRRLSIRIEAEEFSVGFEESAHRNASRYFDNAKHLKQKFQNVHNSIANTRSEMESLAIKAQRDAGKATPLVKKREPEWYERFHWFESSEGFLVLAGRDASTNEVLINRYTEEEDIVFHAEIQGAPFVTIKTGGRLPGDETLLEAAEAAASYSKAWSSGFTSADVYWVNAGQLSKKPPSGQYLGRGMFMVYGQRNYMKPIPLRVAVGIIANENELKLISGPRAAVENRTSYFVELVPGKTRSGELAKRIIHKLSKKVSESVAKTIKNLTLDEIQRMIPAGTGDIVE